MEVKLNNIIPETVYVYNPAGELVGTANEYEFNDLRLQIIQNKAEGWSVKRENDQERKVISKLGTLDWSNVFDLHINQISAILKAQIDSRIKEHP